jgi:phosphoribosylanthranilate isomerase
MRTVKICGINTPDAFDAVVEAGADYLGFIFFEKSPRFVTPAQAAALSQRHQGGPLRVGLFVNPSDDEIRAAISSLKLDVLQIYAPAARTAEIRARFGITTWRAVGVVTRDDLPGAEPVDGFIIESKAPAGATRPGGNAVALDFALLKGWQSPLPWLLAGGLTPDNVAAAIAASGAVGVDVSSGVETAPGVKSAELIRDFVKAVRKEESSFL